MDTVKKELPKPKTYEGMSQYRPPLCFEFVGKDLTLVMDDGFDYQLKFLDREKLMYGRIGENTAVYKYDCLKAEDDTYFVNLEMIGDAVKSVDTFILDMEQSLVTWVNAKMGHNPRLPKQPQTTIVFGAIKGENGAIPTIRHGYTTDMIGKAIHWRYGTLEVVHVYSSERYYRLTMPREQIERMMRENPERAAAAAAARENNGMSGFNTTYVYEEPSDYIKIKDGMYVFSMTECMMNRKRGQGNNLLFLMNLNRMYDVGRSFGYNGEGNPENYTYGAYGEYYDASDLLAKKSTDYIR